MLSVNVAKLGKGNTYVNSVGVIVSDAVLFEDDGRTARGV